ncbi:MAG: nuclear transport factor 2 family protein [Sandaracinaceae bacterium]|nr:MAG: nuclear transport factor 2 family protein [Sandaracinaceae bacterium]
MRPFVSLSLCLILAACGGDQDQRTTPDETGDLEVTAGSGRTATMPPGLDDSRWRWVEAHCTEGPLDLLARGYAAHVRVHQRGENQLLLVHDQQFATESCEHTVVQQATLPEGGGESWLMEEVVRVAVPSTDACYGRPEENRPGDVRMTDGRLEVLVQRSQWCNGLEVRMVYERAAQELLAEDEIVRRYVAHFMRGDADAVAELFAQSGALLEPFTRTETGDPYRHEGRNRVQRWFEESFTTAPWRAMKIAEIEEGEASGGATQRVVTWEYMDPRLTEPMTGRSRFTIAAGEIFELQIELTSEPSLREPAEGEAAEGEEEATET